MRARALSVARQAARGLARCGLPAVAWRVRHVRRLRGRALILMYHRIADEPDYLGRCVPVAVFERQLEQLRRRTQVMPLSAVVDRLQQPEPLAEDIAAITFDDGFRDNLESALPILQRYGLPATVFVTTAFVDGALEPTGDRWLHAFEALWEQRTSPDALGGNGNGVRPLLRAALSRPGSLDTVRQVQRHLKKAPSLESERLLAELELLAGPPRSRRALMLDWDAVRILAACGVEIASHTVSHPILSRVPLDRVEQELSASKARLEAELGRPVLGFAFPNGHRGDFSADHIGLLRRFGYRYACTAEWGGNRPGCDPFRLRRIGVGQDRPALLDLKLALAGMV